MENYSVWTSLTWNKTEEQQNKQDENQTGAVSPEMLLASFQPGYLNGLELTN